MTKPEIVEMLGNIARYYPGTYKLPKSEEGMEDLVESWYIFVSNVDYEVAMQNLAAHIQKKHFPPVISDILQGPVAIKETVPNKAETQLLLAEIEGKPVASKTEVKKGLEMMAKALEKGVQK